MRTMLSVILMLVVTATTAAQDSGKADGRQDEAKAIVSKAAAALKAVKGIVLTEAEKETKGSKVIYELEGRVGGKEYEIKISADGKVLKVEEENDDDDDDVEDDDDDDKDGKDGKENDNDD